jgi:hypothetical protein
MDSQLILKIESLIESLNSKQQIIARNFIIDSSYQIFEMNVLGKKDMYIKEIKSGKSYNFINFIKSRCNCE